MAASLMEKSLCGSKGWPGHVPTTPARTSQPCGKGSHPTDIPCSNLTIINFLYMLCAGWLERAHLVFSMFQSRSTKQSSVNIISMAR